MLAVPPLRTGRASFPAYGSSRHEAPHRSRQRDHLGRLPSRATSFCRELPMMAADACGHRRSVRFLAMCRFTRLGQRCRDGRPDGSGHGFRRRACFIPVSAPLQRGLRFLHPPLPAATSGRLAASLPASGRNDGLTEFHMNNTTGLGAACSPVVCATAPAHTSGTGPTTYLLVQACQLLALVGGDDVYQPLTCVHPTRQPGPLSAS